MCSCTEVGRIGNEVNAAFGERDAADQAFEGEPGTAAGSVDGQGFFGVAGTGRVKLAIAAEERAEVDAVGVDEREKEGGADGASWIGFLGGGGR